jgi:hypothetical protein
MMPEIVTITDEQYTAFLEKAVANQYGRDILNKIIAQQHTPPAKKPAETEQENGGDEG